MLKNLLWIGGVVAVLVLGGFLAMRSGVRPAGEESGELNMSEVVPVDPSSDTTILEAVGNYEGSGVATRSYDEIAFLHTVTAMLDDPASGKFYEGWLVMKTVDGPEFFSTGKLVKQGKEYALSYSSKQNYLEHKDVVVTEETEANGLDNVPEAHVLEGAF